MTGAVTLVVETGEGLPNSNAYADLVFVDDYINATPDAELWSKLTEDDRKRHIIIASNYADSKYGTKYGSQQLAVDQALALPVKRLQTGETGIPLRVKRGVSEYARLSAKGLLFFATEATKDPVVKSKSVKAGPVTTSKTFAVPEDGGAKFKVHTLGDGFFKPYVNTGMNFRTFR